MGKRLPPSILAILSPTIMAYLESLGKSARVTKRVCSLSYPLFGFNPTLDSAVKGFEFGCSLCSSCLWKSASYEAADGVQLIRKTCPPNVSGEAVPLFLRSSNFPLCLLDTHVAEMRHNHKMAPSRLESWGLTGGKV